MSVAERGLYARPAPATWSTLAGQHFNGGGVRFNSGGHLHMVRCAVGNPGGSISASGLWFRPSGAGRLSATDSVLSSDGGSGAGAGIVINPQPGGSAQVNLERVTVNGNAFGIAADGTSSTGGINMTIADSMIGGSSSGRHHRGDAIGRRASRRRR